MVAVYKLNRYDKKSKQKLVDWDVALRHPFDQLTVYTEWLQRIDPQGHISAECLSQLNRLVHNIQAVTEVNQNPRGMLKRISTLARGVLRRQSSSPLLIGPPSSESSSYSPLTPSTAISRASTEFSTGDSGRLKQSSNATPRASMDVSRPHSAGTTVTAMTASDNRIETVTDAHTVSGSMHRISSSVLATKSANSTSASASMVSIASRSVSGTMGGQSNRDSVVCSDAGGSTCSSNSVGSLTLAPSMETLHVKIVTTTITATASPPPAVITTTRPTIPGRQLSLPTERKKFLDDDRERETRRATLRVGTQALITATAESLQSPTFVSRPSIDRLRTITKRETATKPAVKSLISFWEQTSSELVEA
ncbi:hypothetical protein BGZ99_005843 [Dissophora globulifera]|uniref:Uncharacterized protein n=1 Tax=Dissophora globulifera TaxID=979702 RepID=A0A9P6USV9_9FUNG|nr:hypothetical protein BGZ99_005843 [Dissophora globulifera]